MTGHGGRGWECSIPLPPPVMTTTRPSTEKRFPILRAALASGEDMLCVLFNINACECVYRATKECGRQPEEIKCVLDVKG